VDELSTGMRDGLRKGDLIEFSQAAIDRFMAGEFDLAAELERHAKEVR